MILGLSLSLASNQAAHAGGGAPAGATWNPADIGAGITLSGGNLIADVPAGGYHNVRATLAKTTGKWYFEVLIANASTGSINNLAIGLANLSAALDGNYLGSDTNAIGFFGSGFVGNGGGYGGISFGAGAIVGVAFDADAGKVWGAVNNTFTGAPAAGTGGATVALTNYYPALGGLEGKGTARFAAGSQTYSPPAGFTAFG